MKKILILSLSFALFITLMVLFGFLQGKTLEKNLIKKHQQLDGNFKDLVSFEDIKCFYIPLFNKTNYCDFKNITINRTIIDNNTPTNFQFHLGLIKIENIKDLNKLFTLENTDFDIGIHIFKNNNAKQEIDILKSNKDLEKLYKEDFNNVINVTEDFINTVESDKKFSIYLKGEKEKDIFNKLNSKIKIKDDFYNNEIMLNVENLNLKNIEENKKAILVDLEIDLNFNQSLFDYKLNNFYKKSSNMIKIETLNSMFGFVEDNEFKNLYDLKNNIYGDIYNLGDMLEVENKMESFFNDKNLNTFSIKFDNRGQKETIEKLLNLLEETNYIPSNEFKNLFNLTFELTK